MNQSYWAEKQKNQTQMLRVIHDQMNDLHEENTKVADTLGRVAIHMREATKSFVANSKRLDLQSQRIDLLGERIDILSNAIVKWAPITVRQRKLWEKEMKQKEKK